jgi:hypothetical protein
MTANTCYLPPAINAKTTNILIPLLISTYYYSLSTDIWFTNSALVYGRPIAEKVTHKMKSKTLPMFVRRFFFHLMLFSDFRKKNTKLNKIDGNKHKYKS